MAPNTRHSNPSRFELGLMGNVARILSVGLALPSKNVCVPIDLLPGSWAEQRTGRETLRQGPRDRCLPHRNACSQNQPQRNGLVAAARAFSCPGESLCGLRGTLIFKVLKRPDARVHSVQVLDFLYSSVLVFFVVRIEKIRTKGGDVSGSCAAI